MKNNRGFTLIELLAVIVVLAIILAVAVPSISGLINSSTRNAFEMDAKMLTTAIKYKLMEDDSLNLNTINETNVESILKVSDDNYQTVIVSTLRGEPYVIIAGKNKWAGLVASGSYSSMSVSDSSNYTTTMNQLGYDAVKGTNEPKLAAGMTPIKWNGTTWVNTTTRDSDWYNYTTTDKKWANARTADGSMWVWIPRYIYRITTNWHTATAGTIDVQFSMGTDDTRGGTVTLDTGATATSSNNKWTNHPAFKFGDTELTGIWVAKFEPTASEGVANGYTSDSSCPITGDDVSTKTVKILPNVASWRCITVGNAFTTVRNMEVSSVYGWSVASGLQANGIFTTDSNGIDTHLMKNTEWGAIAYLSKSNYGQGINEIYINNNQNYITGCAGNTATAGAYNGCQNTYESTGGVKASTTGNIYGIYDLSGSAWERVSAYVSNGNGNLNTYGSSIISADNKYKNIYTVGATDDQPTNYGLTIDFKSDAVYETSNGGTGSTSWFADYSSMPYSSYPWFFRGGCWDNGSGAGAFGFVGANGIPYGYGGFRPVMLVNTEL